MYLSQLMASQISCNDNAWGILVWEMATLGASPYPGVPHERLVPLLAAGYRLRDISYIGYHYQMIEYCKKNVGYRTHVDCPPFCFSDRISRLVLFQDAATLWLFCSDVTLIFFIGILLSFLISFFIIPSLDKEVLAGLLWEPTSILLLALPLTVRLFTHLQRE